MPEKSSNFDVLPVCREYSTSNGFVIPRNYTFSSDGATLKLMASDKSPHVDSKWIVRCKQTFAEIFLPYGYPESVSEDYLAYQFWDTVQAFCSSLVGTLATHAVLTGLGVGSEDATPLAATLTWLAKDGLGMVGRITFVWLRGCDLDNDLKRWRFVADILNDAAFFVDMMSALVPKIFFTPFVCFSSASRAIVGVAGGATRTALVQHQALKGNAADVSAKDGSQETVVNLTALIMSLLLVPAVEGNHALVWFLYALLTFFHLYANYRAVKTLRLRTFNDKRLGIVVKAITSLPSLMAGNSVAESTNLDYFPTMNDVNRSEPILTPGYQFSCDVCIGVSLAEFFENFSWKASVWTELQSIFKNEEFVLMTSSSRKKVFVVLGHNAKASDIIFCYHLCHVLSHTPLMLSGQGYSSGMEINEIARIYSEMGKLRSSFAKKALAYGWSLDEHNLTITGKYRFEKLLASSKID